ncbi:hypothetical protein [Streptomyces sp. NPDC096323]|uniref:hypothetical protein n=1 Tax=Streptomyces sp. NPDC096323 TaxID=3155822 RepID=UPI00331D0A86
MIDTSDIDASLGLDVGKSEHHAKRPEEQVRAELLRRIRVDLIEPPTAPRMASRQVL